MALHEMAGTDASAAGALKLNVVWAAPATDSAAPALESALTLVCTVDASDRPDDLLRWFAEEHRLRLPTAKPFVPQLWTLSIAPPTPLTAATWAETDCKSGLDVHVIRNDTPAPASTSVPVPASVPVNAPASTTTTGTGRGVAQRSPAAAGPTTTRSISARAALAATPSAALAAAPSAAPAASPAAAALAVAPTAAPAAASPAPTSVPAAAPSAVASSAVAPTDAGVDDGAMFSTTEHWKTVQLNVKAAVADGQGLVAMEAMHELLQQYPSDHGVRVQLGNLYLQAYRYKDALAEFETVIRDHPTVDDAYYGAAQACAELERVPEAIRHLLVLYRGKRATADAKVLLARLAEKSGRTDMAIAIYKEVLQLERYGKQTGRALDEGHLGAVVQFARLSATYGDRGHALAILMRLLIRDSESRAVRQTLTDILIDPANINRLEFPILQSAASLAFLAVLVKDVGLIASAQDLLQRASRLMPQNAPYAVALMHSYDLRWMYAGGVASARTFLTNNPAASVLGVTCTVVLDTLDADVDMRANPAVWLANLRPPVLTIPAELPSSDKPATDLPNDQLDLLALWMTIVKHLFLLGQIRRLLPLIQLIEPLRGDRLLHRTHIRNEHTLYGVVVDLLRPDAAVERLDVPSSVEYPYLYALGDSHVLPLAWRRIQFQGRTHTLYPLMATGVKAWHLRKAGKFFPKAHVHRMLQMVPRGSSVIVNIGEIDCREGIVAAVSKGRFQTLTIASQTIVEQYVSALLDMRRTYHVHFYVHPVNGILNETRVIVNEFNAFLERAVRDTLGLLKWIDGMSEHLLEPVEDASPTAAGVRLRTEFILDGTHLHPRYVVHLEAALERDRRPDGDASTNGTDEASGQPPAATEPVAATASASASVSDAAAADAVKAL